MDEFVYDPGDPVGGAPSIGSIDTTSTAFNFTIRSADNNGFYWQEYDNVAPCLSPSRKWSSFTRDFSWAFYPERMQ
jgi:hypothetical protein